MNLFKGGLISIQYHPCMVFRYPKYTSRPWSSKTLQSREKLDSLPAPTKTLVLLKNLLKMLGLEKK